MFSPQSETHTAKLCFSVIFEHFWEKSQRTSLFSQKDDYLRKEPWNTQKVFFLTCLKMRKILRNIWICLNNCFWSNQLKGTIINKDCFSPQSEPHTAKLCFSVVFKHFCWNSPRNYLFSQKSDYLRKEHWNSLKRGKSWEKFGFV